MGENRCCLRLPKNFPNIPTSAIVRYIVAPREAGPVETGLIKKLLPALNAASDKVLFPKGPNR